MIRSVRDWHQFGRGTLLAIHAHPDDETLSTGGLLAAWHRAGGRVVVITATRGERGETITDEFRHLEGDHERLVARRLSELRAALAALGVDEHRFLDTYAEPTTRWEDSGMAWLDTSGGTAGATVQIPQAAFVAAALDDVTAAFEQVVKEFQPQVIATYGPDGGYGHPDHVRVHQITMAVTRTLTERGLAPVEAVLWRAVNPHTTSEVAAALSQRWRQLQPEISYRAGHRRTLRAPNLATSPPSADNMEMVQVPLGDVIPNLLDAMRAHRTQIQFVRRIEQTSESTQVNPLIATYALSNGVLQGIETHETYRVSQLPFQQAQVA